MDWLMPEWLLAISVTVFVVDIFWQTEILSWSAVLITAGYITWRVGVPLKWGIAVFLVSTIVVGMFYHFFLRAVVGMQVRMLQGGAPNETIDSIRGAEATIHIVDGRTMLRWNGDELWPVKNPPAAPVEGQRVKIARLENGLAVIQ